MSDFAIYVIVLYHELASNFVAIQSLSHYSLGTRSVWLVISSN